MMGCCSDRGLGSRNSESAEKDCRFSFEGIYVHRGWDVCFFSLSLLMASLTFVQILTDCPVDVRNISFLHLFFGILLYVAIFYISTHSGMTQDFSPGCCLNLYCMSLCKLLWARGHPKSELPILFTSMAYFPKAWNLMVTTQKRGK